jgi:hypothetical protein
MFRVGISEDNCKLRTDLPEPVSPARIVTLFSLIVLRRSSRARATGSDAAAARSLSALALYGLPVWELMVVDLVCVVVGVIRRFQRF